VREVGADYFREGVFRGARPGELFAACSCVQCGHRSTTWAAFRAHRAVCQGTPGRHGATAAAPALPDPDGGAP
jgi:hypothetical protein